MGSRSRGGGDRCRRGRTEVKARDGGRRGWGHVAGWTWAWAAYGRRGQVSALPESAYAYRTRLVGGCTAGLKQGHGTAKKVALVVVSWS
jgi:hypothetical protein